MNCGYHLKAVEGRVQRGDNRTTARIVYVRRGDTEDFERLQGFGDAAEAKNGEIAARTALALAHSGVGVWPFIETYREALKLGPSKGARASYRMRALSELYPGGLTIETLLSMESGEAKPDPQSDMLSDNHAQELRQARSGLLNTYRSALKKRLSLTKQRDAIDRMIESAEAEAAQTEALLFAIGVEELPTVEADDDE